MKREDIFIEWDNLEKKNVKATAELWVLALF